MDSYEDLEVLGSFYFGIANYVFLFYQMSEVLFLGYVCFGKIALGCEGNNNISADMFLGIL